jgi:micrococcal nuclease
VQRAILLGSFVALLLVSIAGCGEDKSAGTDCKFKVERVIDGDTIVLVGGRTVRYIGINTPEKGEPYYEEAKEANRRLVEGKDVKLELDEQEKDLYGRTLAYVYVGDTFVNVQLVREGCARAYPYPPNVKYDDIFSNAEKEARQKRIGIWSSRPQGHGIEITEINFDPPGNDRDNLNGEWVIITNNTNAPIDMTGYTLSDDSDHVYNFEDFALPAGATVTVFVGSGADTPTSLYWGSKTPIWNNDGDTAYLKDADGSLVDEYLY